MKTHALFGFALSACLLLALPLRADALSDETWYVVLNGEDRIGYMHATLTSDDKTHQITTGQTVKLALARGAAVINIEVASSFVETNDGRPVSATSKVNMGGVPIESRAVFKEKAIELTAGQGGRTSTTMKPPIAGDWLPPYAMRRHIEAQLAAGAEQLSVRTVDISMGLQALVMSMKVVGREDVEVYGKTVPAIVWDATVSSLPGMTMREYVDETGESIKTTMALMPGLELTIVQADKALALSELTPAEMMAQTFVVPSRKIEKPRELKRGNYTLRMRNDEAGVSLPNLEGQYVYNPGDDETGVIIVTEDGRFPGGMPRRAFPKPDLDRYLVASPVLNHEDPAVRAWLEPLQRVRLAGGQAGIAEFLRQQVHENIQTKDLSVGFATASDVARTKQGDCTEHAVLLAALLRGAGTPSRCVSGLVYADQFAGHEGIFGYHMWTQAWIPIEEQPDGFGGGGGRWVDLDATLPGGVAFDATHIALSVSDMNEGVLGNDMAALLPVLGNLEIEVVETHYGDAED